ncbi:hypothetical protein [Aureimonas leprariae]|uniref:Uncharacterized protein n=1 Tax=Plantimonas leprariae TaxID=2615207 RepID=A0A7V7TYW2_9HYPH|nr:hypothetical protein [Aureimonas leprariae]KAB0678048.1 hypothetical protein F6X38_16615 [Aureimonas leprariae]
MARTIPYLFCRYDLTINEMPLSGSEQHDALAEIRGQMVTHRQPDADEDEGHTFAMRAKHRQLNNHFLLTWAVGYQITQRTIANYNDADDEVDVRIEEGDGIRYAPFVALPELGVLGVCDRSGDPFIGARAGIARFKSVFRKAVDGGDVSVRPAASPQDRQRALKTWDLKRFDFTIRPFNPHPSDPGRKLSELLENERIGKLSGYAVPKEGSSMRLDEGYITEAVGLADSGYGTYGLRGVTEGGLEAAIVKSPYSDDRKKIQQRQADPQVLRVSVEPQRTFDLEANEVAKALIEFYGDEP